MSSLAKKLTRLLHLPATCGRSIHITPALRMYSEKKNPVRSRCTLVPGDGVGPELMDCLQKVIKAIDAPIDFDIFPISEVKPVPNIKFEDVKRSILKNKACIKGTLDRTKQGLRSNNMKSLNMRFRTELDLFASVVHVRSLPGVKCRHKNVDAIIIRENTEGEYSTLEHECVPGVVECLKIITSDGSKRIAKFALDYATQNKRKKLTVVHKANIMKLADGMFLRSCEQMGQLYPRVKVDKMIVDNTTMQMISKPTQFDVVVTPNLYGNIVINLAAGLVGGAGVVAGTTYSSEIAIFEPGAHHTYQKARGKNIANPTAMLICGANLLHHFNLPEMGDRIMKAIFQVLGEGKCITEDIGGCASTQEFVDAVIDALGCGSE